jgi:hypothetical protein
MSADNESGGGGPYEVRACRGHFHVTICGHDILTDAGDAMPEDVARAECARLNALFATDWTDSGAAQRDAL